jgi:hypothetical protein
MVSGCYHPQQHQMRGGNWHAAPGTGSMPKVCALDIALNTGFPLYFWRK